MWCFSHTMMYQVSKGSKRQVVDQLLRSTVYSCVCASVCERLKNPLSCLEALLNAYFWECLEGQRTFATNSESKLKKEKDVSGRRRGSYMTWRDRVTCSLTSKLGVKSLLFFFFILGPKIWSDGLSKCHFNMDNVWLNLVCCHNL